jgi:hypothetical protein
MGSIMEPLFKTSTKPTVVLAQNGSHGHAVNNTESDTYRLSLNLFSTENNKHTYSFEKSYYTRFV